jgi:hypothetical protein
MMYDCAIDNATGADDMNATLNARAIELAEQDISLEAGMAQLMHEGKALIPSIGFEAAVDAFGDASNIFERHHWAASERRLRERNAINGFRFIPRLG